ncbi:MAG: site-2 protease family protein [Candidatus Micrarchaeota archaeon]|nr:site-2 protease family protein [Candidatus Micrarchaeota archaeon]MDE1823749.1 site-2 protease family protein [Candidatus Micrarchaeota archaeon]MDE1849546.1 site-2 protease family protein [Candidatus Micrarchaeota archaeon]
MSAGSFAIGRIFGIQIELHWTFILFLLLPLLLQAYGLFLILLLLFICVLVHELTHSVTAIKNGISVSKIILLPIGGASIIDTTKIINPKVEFNIAVVGPLMSLFLGGIFGVLVVFMPPGFLTQVIQQLFVINMALGALNLLPAFPMDGGRVFRSYLERKHSLYDATMLAIRVSKYTMALIIIGTLVFLYTVGIGYPSYYKELVFFWNLIIVFFLYSGMEAERESMIVRKNTAHLSLKDAMSRHFVYVKPETRAERLYPIIRKRKEYTIITRKEGEYAVVNTSGSGSTVADMAMAIPNIQIKAKLIDALYSMESSDMKIAAVVSGSRLMGIVTIQHIQAFISLHMINRNPGHVDSKS